MTIGYTRREFYSRIGLVRNVEPLVQSAYEFGQWLKQGVPDQGAAADDKWHVSFHGSQFPGDDPRACGRRAIYTMMSIPRNISPRWLEQVADAGKDIEDRIVQKVYEAGYLLSRPPFDYLGNKQSQTQFEDPSVWLTSTVDSIMVHPTSNRGEVVEIKSKYADDIEEMIRLNRGPDPKHVFQVKAQIGLAHEHGPWKVKRCYNSGRLGVKIGLADNDKPIVICPEHRHTKCLRDEVLEPVTDGSIYYVSRDHPTDTWEFFYEYDPDFMEAGRKMLRNWREWWQKGKLPQTNLEDKRFSHPFGWTWTKSQKDPLSPCEWCDYGDICRDDHKAAVKQGEPINLEDSAGIEVALEVREDYDLDLVRAAVDRRWGIDKLAKAA